MDTDDSDDDSITAMVRATLTAHGVGRDHPASERIEGRTQTTRAGSARPRRALEHLPAAEIGEDPGAQLVLRSELGRGGMGVVWLAFDRTLEREVAVKRLRRGTGSAVERLMREATIGANLEHPGIVPVHALVRDDEGPAVVMRRIGGTSWRELIRHGNAPLDRHLEIFVSLCNAVSFAHSRGILHRDIKPSNVMIGEFGEVYLMDWGIACFVEDVRSDELAGTAQYMAPEMACGKADVRSDVFLLGASLHDAVTGRPRHDFRDSPAALTAATRLTPFEYGPEVPGELAAICNRACAFDPNERFQSAMQLRDAIRQFRSHQSASELARVAEERRRELSEAVARGETADYPRVQRLFIETRFAFREALRQWPQSPDAQRGLRETLRAMTVHEIELGHADAAAALSEEIEEPEAELRARIDALRAAQAEERQRLSVLERERDPTVGAEGRARAYAAFGVAVIAMTLVLAGMRLWLPSHEPTNLRLTIVGVIVLALLAAAVWWWRRHADWNEVNRSIAYVTLVTVGLSLGQRALGLVAGASPTHVLTTDAVLLCFGGLILASFHAAGRWLAAVAAAVAVAGAVWPSWIQGLFIALAVFIPALALAWRRLRR